MKRLTPKQRVLRQHPNTVWCRVLHGIYGGRGLDIRLGWSWSDAARRLKRVKHG